MNQDVKIVTFAEVTDGNKSFEIKLPELRTQSLATRVIVQSGQTVVMGGSGKGAVNLRGISAYPW